MKPIRCLLGFHDWYAVFPPLILMVKRGPGVEYAEQAIDYQYVTIKRICIRCKHREQHLITLSGDLSKWDVEKIREAVKK